MKSDLEFLKEIQTILDVGKEENILPDSLSLDDILPDNEEKKNVN